MKFIVSIKAVIHDELEIEAPSYEDAVWKAKAQLKEKKRRAVAFEPKYVDIADRTCPGSELR